MPSPKKNPYVKSAPPPPEEESAPVCIECEACRALAIRVDTLETQVQQLLNILSVKCVHCGQIATHQTRTMGIPQIDVWVCDSCVHPIKVSA